jgi:hypothetical protein
MVIEGAEWLNLHQFGGIAGLIDIGALECGDITAQQLQRLKTLKRLAKPRKLVPGCRGCVPNFRNQL